MKGRALVIAIMLLTAMLVLVEMASKLLEAFGGL